METMAESGSCPIHSFHSYYNHAISRLSDKDCGARLAPAAAGSAAERVRTTPPSWLSSMLRLGPAALRFGGGFAALGPLVFFPG
jgi:hypothetical protein